MLIDTASPATQSSLGALVGVTQQAISAMMAEGKIPSEGSIGDLLLAYCQRLRDQAAGRLGSDVGPLDLVQERAALAREQRIGIELKNAVARGEFASISLLSEVLATASQAVIERFDQLPAMLKKACPDLGDAARAQVMAALASARNEWVRETSNLITRRVEAMQEDDEVLDA